MLYKSKRTGQILKKSNLHLLANTQTPGYQCVVDTFLKIFGPNAWGTVAFTVNPLMCQLVVWVNSELYHSPLLKYHFAFSSNGISPFPSSLLTSPHLALLSILSISSFLLCLPPFPSSSPPFSLFPFLIFFFPILSLFHPPIKHRPDLNLVIDHCPLTLCTTGHTLQRL